MQVNVPLVLIRFSTVVHHPKTWHILGSLLHVWVNAAKKKKIPKPLKKPVTPPKRQPQGSSFQAAGQSAVFAWTVAPVALHDSVVNDLPSMRFSRFLTQGRQPNPVHPGRRCRALLLSRNRVAQALALSHPAPRPATTILGSFLPSRPKPPEPPGAGPRPYLGEHLLELALGHRHGRSLPVPVSLPVSVPPARPYINTGSGRAPASGGGAAPARHGAGTERHRGAAGPGLAAKNLPGARTEQGPLRVLFCSGVTAQRQRQINPRNTAVRAGSVLRLKWLQKHRTKQATAWLFAWKEMHEK